MLLATQISDVHVCIINYLQKYPAEENITASALQLWIQLNRGNVASKWILPSGVKSLSLSREIDKGPALILFTPYRPLLQINQYYSLVSYFMTCTYLTYGGKFSQ